MAAPVGIVLVTHGSYGQSLLDSACAIVGPIEKCLPIAIAMSDRQPEVARKIDDAVHNADSGAGVLVCADLCGSTPGNACMAVAKAAQQHGDRVAVVFGLSLPMLMKLAALDRATSTPARLAEQCADTARKSVRVEGGTDAPR
jgi:PTS system mannose-specific IIA component